MLRAPLGYLDTSPHWIIKSQRLQKNLACPHHRDYRKWELDHTQTRMRIPMRMRTFHILPVLMPVAKKSTRSTNQGHELTLQTQWTTAVTDCFWEPQCWLKVFIFPSLSKAIRTFLWHNSVLSALKWCNTSGRMLPSPNSAHHACLTRSYTGEEATSPLDALESRHDTVVKPL